MHPDQWSWIARPHEAGEPARHVAELSELAGFDQVRGNVWRYEPAAKGRRHRHPLQSVNHGDEDLLVYAYGTPPETEHAELLDSAV